MKPKLLLLFLFTFFINRAQVQDTLKMTTQDSAVLYSIELKEVIVGNDAIEEERKKILLESFNLMAKNAGINNEIKFT